MAWWQSTGRALPTSVRTFFRLTAVDRRCFVAASLLLPLTAVAFRCLGVRRWQATLERWSPRPDAGATAATAVAQRTAWLVQAAARYFAGRDSCLSQSLVLWWLLRYRGMAAEVRVGARRHADGLQAHAWVEYRGRVLNDRGDEGSPFVSFDRALVPL
jgi:Transglutaminase-like superfamily